MDVLSSVNDDKFERPLQHSMVSGYIIGKLCLEAVVSTHVIPSGSNTIETVIGTRLG